MDYYIILNRKEKRMNKVENEQRIKDNDIVRHFKKETVDNSDPNQYLYKVLCTNARETDNYERQVVYMALYTRGDVKAGDIFVRDYDEFMSEVDRKKYPNIKQRFRFEPINN